MLNLVYLRTINILFLLFLAMDVLWKIFHKPTQLFNVSPYDPQRFVRESFEGQVLDRVIVGLVDHLSLIISIDEP